MKWLPAGLVVSLVSLVSANADSPSAKDSPPANAPHRGIDDLVAELGHPVFGVREKAQRALWQRGLEATPALEKAARGENPEVVRRAREILDQFAWGIRPDTPPEVLNLIRQFRAGDPTPERSDEVRKQAVIELLKHGRIGVAVVRAILNKDLPADSREKLAAHVTAIVRREVPLLLMAGKAEEADELIALHATGTTPAGSADFAAYHALRGDLPDAIAKCESAIKTARRPAALKLVLTHLYRAAGLWEKARDAAADLPPRGAEEAGYGELLLEDERNWSALADLPPGRELNHPAAVRLTLLRLAGRKEKFEAEAKKLRAEAAEFTNAADIMDAAVALLANHHAVAAAELLLARKEKPSLSTEILIASMRYKAALALIDSWAGEERATYPGVWLRLARARVLLLTGDRGAAVELFEKVARDQAEQRVEKRQIYSSAARSLIRTELRLGLRDLACRHAARFAMGSVAEDGGESPFELLFPTDLIAAGALFDVLRTNKVPGDDPGETMIRVRDLLSGTAGKAAIDAALKLLRESTALGAPALLSDANKRVKASRCFALATLYRVAKRQSEAEAAFKLAAELEADCADAADATGARSWVYGTPDPARIWVEWGEFLADAGRFRDAAAVLEVSARLFPDQPLPLFLSGQALLKAGEVKEGERRIELSHWVSLGNERVRGRFLDELVRRGEARAIKREIALILKACWSHDHYFGNVMNQCARGANLVGDYATAELCGQRSLLVVLRSPGVYFVDSASYLSVPQDIRAFHAKAQLDAGRISEAMATAREILAVTPSHLELVSDMVPELDRRGRKKEADELFALAWSASQKVLADYPKSIAARHALAQLAGRCGRKLDEGLDFAKAAVADDRDSRSYREALAEVHFRRGERLEAVKLMQALLAEQPRNPLYRRQIERYRSAAFDSPWPATAD